jgi:glycosyltransferase involved in cell wall biosynthesis
MIYFLIPVFNEEGNIANLHRELTSVSVGDQVSYVFSDDGSSDQSLSLIRKIFHGTNFTILGDGVNRGPGAAFNIGFDWILSDSKNDTDTIVTLEADCTSDLGILKTMLMLNEHGYDLVLASVYAQGGGFDRTSFLRKFVSATANFLYRFLFDIQVLTLSSFYRVYKISLVRKISKEYNGKIIEEPGFVSMLEILAKSIWCHARVIEVPMKLQSLKRVGGSKMKVLKTTFHYFRYLFHAKFFDKHNLS